MRKAPASAFLRRRMADWFYRVDWQPQPLTDAGAVGPATWLLLDNGSQLGAELAQRLTSRGDRCVIESEGAGPDPSEFRRLLEERAAREGPPRRRVHRRLGSQADALADPAERAQN